MCNLFAHGALEKECTEMRREAVKSLLTFLLALVLTAAAVAVLSLLSHGQAGQEFSAVAQEAAAAEKTLSSAQITAARSSELPLLACAGGFGLVLALVGAGLWGYRRARRKGRELSQGRRSYCPRADMTFSGRNRV